MLHDVTGHLTDNSNRPIARHPPFDAMTFPLRKGPIAQPRSWTQGAAGSVLLIGETTMTTNHGAPLCTSRATKTVPARMSMCLKNRNTKMKIS